MNELKTLTQGIVMYLCAKYEVSTPVQVGRIQMSHTHTHTHTHTDGEIDMIKNINFSFKWINIDLTEAKRCTKWSKHAPLTDCMYGTRNWVIGDVKSHSVV